MLRNSGAVLEELEYRDIVLQRRDGENVYLALQSRERDVRESLAMMARMLRVALREEGARTAIERWLADELPWTSFLPPADRRAFLDDLSRTSTACVELGQYGPLGEMLRGWKATAEVYANPRIVGVMRRSHAGPSVAIPRPGRRRVRAR